MNTDLPTLDGIDRRAGQTDFFAGEKHDEYFCQRIRRTAFRDDFRIGIADDSQLDQHSAAQSIQPRLRRGRKPRDGKKYKLEVKVDVNGDGIYEEKEYIVQHRPFYNAPKDETKKK